MIDSVSIYNIIYICVCVCLYSLQKGADLTRIEIRR
jgi:hypothetical protein